MPADDGNGRVRNAAAAAAALENTSGAGDGRRSRSRGRDEPVVVADAAVSPDFESLMAGLRSEVLAHVDKNLKTTAEQLTMSFTGVARALDVKSEKRFSALEGSMAELGSSQSTLEAQVDVLKGELREVQKQLHIQENATTLADPPASGRPFDGPIDKTILRVETFAKEIISKATLDSYLSDLFLDANVLREQYEVNGDDADCRFIIKFKGGAGIAIRNLEQARTTLREDSGKYKELSVCKPAGGSTRIFINPDKNPKMQKIERETKRLGLILRDMYQGTKWHINRTDGEISKGWKQIVKLEVNPNDVPTKILWNLEALSETNIVKQDVVANFSSTARERVRVNWQL
jgi:hypothetical protein